jgi:diguanylate cyclase (GGDEF)-like protein
MDDFEAPNVDPAILIRKRHGLALMLIALLLAASQIVTQLTLAQGDDDSRLVNVSGRQRMLSQQIAKLALEISYAKDMAGRIGPVRELYGAVMTFQGTHDGLLKGSSTLDVKGRNSARILELYAQIEPAYYGILKAASSMRERATAADGTQTELLGLSEKILTMEGVFLDGMNKVVFQYDAEASQRRSLTRDLEFILFGLILVALVMEAFFIFRPAERQISRYFLSLHKAMAKLREQATYDALTGLYNRGAGLLLLEHEMDKARRARSPLTIVFVDLDGLKTVNDLLGHEEGDSYISGFASIVAGSVRAGDMALRYGGDEFVLILNCDSGQAESIISRIDSLVAEANAKQEGGWTFGFSYGMTSFDPTSSATADSLLVAADEAMYRMKEEHRRSGRSPIRK